MGLNIGQYNQLVQSQDELIKIFDDLDTELGLWIHTINRKDDDGYYIVPSDDPLFEHWLELESLLGYLVDFCERISGIAKFKEIVLKTYLVANKIYTDEDIIEVNDSVILKHMSDFMDTTLPDFIDVFNLFLRKSKNNMQMELV